MKPLEFIATVFIVKDCKVLLLFNKKLNNWTPPGGHVEKYETPCQAAVREVKEETGYIVEIIGEKPEGSTFLHTPRCIHHDILPFDHDHNNLIYFARIVSGEQQRVTDEDWEMKWFSKEDLNTQSLFPNIRTMGMKAIDELK